MSKTVEEMWHRLQLSRWPNRLPQRLCSNRDLSKEPSTTVMSRRTIHTESQPLHLPINHSNRYSSPIDSQFDSPNLKDKSSCRTRSGSQKLLRRLSYNRRLRFMKMVSWWSNTRRCSTRPKMSKATCIRRSMSRGNMSRRLLGNSKPLLTLRPNLLE